ncbi:acetate--CoA ligase family protein [Pseudalkalibacillus sp. A8]|uniref:acetate--CoA ligase family protein n=1 Tax=Pseudalkalibacillus sp. A8 TaxID=3382641 RepID=UPI0038B58B65
MIDQRLKSKVNQTLTSLLKPESIAIIGASPISQKINGRPIEYLRRYGYNKNVYPINPKYNEIQGYKAYGSIHDIKDEIDVAIIALGKNHVLDALHQCIIKKVKNVIIFSSGFAEMDAKGKDVQLKIKEAIRGTGTRVVGPNCQGMNNLKSKSMISFSTSFTEGELREGNAAIVSQSGAIASMFYNLLSEKYGTGVNYWFATGNEADVNVVDLVDVLIDEKDVDVIHVYLEDIKDGEAFKKAALKAQRNKKPILVLKSGRTSEGKKAAQSHTGALAGEDDVFDVFSEKYGITRVDNIEELAGYSLMFQQQEKRFGRNVAFLSNSGGLGVMMVDKAKELGLNVTEFDKQTIVRLKEILPVFASLTNPIDVTAQLLNDRNLFSKTLPVLLEDQNVDSIVIGLGTIGKGYDIEAIVQDIVEAQKSDKIVAVSWVGSKNNVVKDFGLYGVPVFEDTTLCIKALRAYISYCEFLSESDDNISTMNQPLLTNKKNITATSNILSEYESKQILREHQFPTVRELFCRDYSEIFEKSSCLNYPLVLKMSSPTIAHKTEMHGVILNIKDEKMLRDAYQTMKKNIKDKEAEKDIDGFLIQEMINGGLELSLGFKRDPTFGPVIMIAAGGIYIEALKDFTLALPPIQYEEAKRKVEGLKIYPFLKGVRGQPPLDVEGLFNMIVKYSEFIQRYEDVIEEMDMNPIIIKEQGVHIVDAMIKLRDKE